MRRLLIVPVVCVLAAAASCASPSTNPSSPSSVNPAKTNAAADGSTLKATAPSAQSPINNLRLTFGGPITLLISNATTPFVPGGVPLTYKFEVYSAAGQRVYVSPNVAAGTSTTSHLVTATLDGDQTFTWQARAEYQGSVGPWSPRASFVTAVTQPDGYIRGNDLYDPLTNGKTIGTIGGSGNVTWIPGQGIRMNDELAYVVYPLPTVFSSGEMSVEVTGLNPGGPCCKPRIFSILDRQNAIASASKYSFNVQYRGAGGAPDNCITFKAILGDNANSVEPDDRFANTFLLDPSKVYLWSAFWTSTSFRLVVREGGATGPVLFDDRENATSGTTNWNPPQMFAFLGTNNGAFVQFDGTRAGMTLKNLWVSNSPRPATLP